MRTKTLAIDSISRAAYNPRVPLGPGMAEYERIKASIETFGLVEPLVWNERSGNLVGGHQRLTVLEAMGETKVMVSVVDLDDEQERVLNIALNKISGIWDEGALAALLAPMSADMVTLTGFDLAELKGMLPPTPPDDFAEFNENIETAHTCPKCGYAWSGGE